MGRRGRRRVGPLEASQLRHADAEEGQDGECPDAARGHESAAAHPPNSQGDGRVEVERGLLEIRKGAQLRGEELFVLGGAHRAPPSRSA